VTKNQANALSYLESQPYPVGFSEIGQAIGIASTQHISDIIAKLEALGMVKREYALARSIIATTPNAREYRYRHFMREYIGQNSSIRMVSDVVTI